MAESNRMKEMPVNKLMVQMGIPMILSMALQAVYNIVDSAFVGNMRSGSEAEKMISDTDKRRRANYNFYTEQKWGMADNYTLSLNSSVLGHDRCEKIIMDCALNT